MENYINMWCRGEIDDGPEDEVLAQLLNALEAQVKEHQQQALPGMLNESANLAVNGNTDSDGHEPDHSRATNASLASQGKESLPMDTDELAETSPSSLEEESLPMDTDELAETSPSSLEEEALPMDSNELAVTRTSCQEVKALPMETHRFTVSQHQHTSEIENLTVSRFSSVFPQNIFSAQENSTEDETGIYSSGMDGYLSLTVPELMDILNQS